MTNKKFVILNMSNDKNKGDLAILESLVKLLKIKSKNISVINADLNEIALKSQIWTSKLGIMQFPSFFPTVLNNNKIKKIFNHIYYMLYTIILLILIILLQDNIKYLMFIFPKSYKNSINAILSADTIFVKGGSFLYNYGNIFNELYFYRMIYPIIISIYLNKRIYFMGVSIGPLKTKLSQHLLEFSIKNSKKTILREYISFNFIKKLKLDTYNIMVLPDLAFMNQFNEGVSTINAFKKENIPYIKSHLKIGITARYWKFPQSGKNGVKTYNNYKNTFINSCKIIQDKYNADLYFLPHYLGDLNFEENILKEFPNNAYILKGDYSINDLKYLYSKLDYLIGVRLHSCILALSVNTPALHIAYMRNKGIGTYSLLGLKDYVLDASSISTNSFVMKFNKMVKNRNNITHKLNKKSIHMFNIINNEILREI